MSLIGAEEKGNGDRCQLFNNSTQMHVAACIAQCVKYGVLYT